MLTANHGAVAVVACLGATIVPFGPTPTTVVIGLATSLFAAFHSMRPDLIGLKGGSGKGHFEAYNSAHSGEIAMQEMRLPAWRLDKWIYLFHLWLDQFYHNPDPPYGYTTKGKWLAALDTILLSLILAWETNWWLMVMIWAGLWLWNAAYYFGAKE